MKVFRITYLCILYLLLYYTDKSVENTPENPAMSPKPIAEGFLLTPTASANVSPVKSSRSSPRKASPRKTKIIGPSLKGLLAFKRKDEGKMFSAPKKRLEDTEVGKAIRRHANDKSTGRINTRSKIIINDDTSSK